MKRTLIASLALLIAASLFAAEDKPQQTTTTPDSPLVAAAKKSNRAAKKKRVVITNDTLKSSTGHVSSATGPVPAMAPLDAPKPLEQSAAENKARVAEQAAAKVKADKAAADERQKQTASAARAEDEGPYNEGRPPDTPKKPEDKKP